MSCIGRAQFGSYQPIRLGYTKGGIGISPLLAELGKASGTIGSSPSLTGHLLEIALTTASATLHVQYERPETFEAKPYDCSSP